jgi:hypothetical protein
MPSTPSPNRPRITPRQLNELNRQFWAQQSELTERRSSEPILHAGATASMNSEVIRGIPLKLRKTLELALADAESDKIGFQSDGHSREGSSTRADPHREFCRKGGRARKGDSLSKLIERLVRVNPKITERQLFWRLNREVGKGVIFSIDAKSSVIAGNVRVITFEDDHGRRKTASVSGLKDRLARAKAKMHSL